MCKCICQFRCVAFQPHSQSAFTERFIQEKKVHIIYSLRQWTVGWVVRCVSYVQTYALQSASRTTQ